MKLCHTVPEKRKLEKELREQTETGLAKKGEREEVNKNVTSNPHISTKA